MTTVTLISDFGNTDNAVAIAKGILLQQHSGLRLLDITHEVLPCNLIQCSYLLKSAFRFFPANTIHVSLFDVMHQVPAAVLITKIDDQFIVTADNGLLHMAFPDDKLNTYNLNIDSCTSYTDWVLQVGKMIVDLEQVNFDLEKLNISAYEPQVKASPLTPLIKQASIECHVLHIDIFGNVVLNVHKNHFDQYRQGRNFSIQIPRNVPIKSICQNYADVPTSAVFAIFNTSGYLEIGIRNSNASRLLGLEMYNPELVFFKTIVINFE